MLECIIGENVKQERERLGWDIAWLAKESGLKKARISQIESGRRNVSLLELKHIADAFHTPLFNLFNEGVKERDFNTLGRFVQRNIPLTQTHKDAAPYMLIGGFGSQLLERLTISDVENSAQEAATSCFSVIESDDRQYGIEGSYCYNGFQTRVCIPEISVDYEETAMIADILTEYKAPKGSLREIIEDLLVAAQ